VKRVVLPTRSSEDIAGPAVFLASDLSVYVTGHIIRTDGGYRTV
jgi:enoyl-[acyl-carrier-protein] reductase (NADH)